MKAIPMFAVAALSAGLLSACGDDDGGGSAASFCDAVRAFDEQGSTMSLIFSGNASPEELEAAVATMGGELDSLRASAPSDVKADVTTVTNGFKEVFRLMGEYDYDIIALSASAEFQEFQASQSDAMDAATDRLDAYTERECGLVVGDS